MVAGFAIEGLAVVEAVERRLEAVRLVGVVLAVVGFEVVVARGEALVLVADVGFRAAAVVEAVLEVAGLVVLAVVEEVVPGTTDCRRAGPLIVAVLFSLSETDGRDLWVAVAVVPVAPGTVGFFTVPAGGLVGGCFRPLVGLAAELVADLEAVVPVTAGRRTPVVVEEAPAFARGDATLGGVEPLGALFLGVAVGEAVAPVPLVSSPDKMDSSRLTTSKPSDSDMMVARQSPPALLVPSRICSRFVGKKRGLRLSLETGLGVSSNRGTESAGPNAMQRRTVKTMLVSGAQDD